MMLDVKVGSDPEFGYYCQLQKCQVRAQTLSIHDGSVPGKGNWGLDGHSDIGEIRAEPSLHVREHVNNIRDILEHLADGLLDYPTLTQRAGSYIWENIRADSVSDYGDELGGHIHLSSPDMHIGNSAGLMRELGEALDYWATLPVALIEKPETARMRRGKGAYGRLGDVRPAPWGIEYRPMGSWLVSPGVAMAALSLAQAVAHGVLNDTIPPLYLNKERWRALRSQHVAMDEDALLLHYFTNVEPFMNSTFFPLLAQDRDVAGAVGYLKHLIMAGKKWREDEDLRTMWGVGHVLSGPEIREVIINDVSMQKRLAASSRFEHYSFVRWPGPGQEGHSICRRIFNDGRRILRANNPQLSFFVGVYPHLPGGVKAVHGFGASMTRALRDLCPHSLSALDVRATPPSSSLLLPTMGIAYCDYPIRYLILDQGWLQETISREPNKFMSGQWGQEMFDFLLHWFNSAHSSYRSDVYQMEAVTDEVPPSDYVTRGGYPQYVLGGYVPLRSTYTRYIWHSVQLES